MTDQTQTANTTASIYLASATYRRRLAEVSPDLAHAEYWGRLAAQDLSAAIGFASK
jgi:hypothetical protein